MGFKVTCEELNGFSFKMNSFKNVVGDVMVVDYQDAVCVVQTLWINYALFVDYSENECD